MAGIAVAAGSGALQGALAGAAGGPIGILVGAIVGGALGAGVGAIGLLLSKGDGGGKRHKRDYIDTTSIRGTPVPVAFGRVRGGGNWIAVGAFLVIKDKLDGTPGRHLRRCNAILALCEGPITDLGNIRQDGQRLKALARPEKLDVKRYFKYILAGGTNDEDVPARVDAAMNGYTSLPHVPWRNTAKLVVFTVVGETSRLPSVNADWVGPDLTVRRSGSSEDESFADTPLYGFYDSHTESFYYLTAADGLVKLPRAAEGREATAPPDGVTGVTNAWYIGRHDVLLMQDPTDSTVFYLGHWGVTGAPAPDGWEAFHPIPGAGGAGYESPIICWHLDEAHAVLHTLHGTSSLYVMRWWLLTGRIERTDLDLPSGTYKAMLYSPDMDAYLFAAGSADLRMVDPRDGTTLATTAAVPTSDCLGLCVSGHLIGVISDGALNYYDIYEGATLGPYGSSDTGTSAGSLGGIVSASQNTATGHITVTKTGGAMINFIASVLEDTQDISANGTGGLLKVPPPLFRHAEPDFQTFPEPDPVAGWVRDWSYRQPGSWNLVALEGKSSLAAAAWASLASEPNLDSARWGAGLDARYFSLGSFEGLHAWCVGGVMVPNTDGSRHRCERYKFDYLLNSESTAASFVADQVLLCCQGYRMAVGGVMHVGAARPGVWPAWHYADSQRAEPEPGGDTLTVQYLGRGGGVNRVRVQYTEVLNEYQTNFAEANDEWDQVRRGRVQARTLDATGCGRYGQADLLAKTVLDQSLGGRRQFAFPTHFLGLLLNCADVVEVTSRQCALSRVLAEVVSIAEDQADGRVSVVAVEHRVALDALRGGVAGAGELGEGDLGLEDDTCHTADSTVDGSVVWFAGGASYQVGTYTVNYLGGTYRPASGWHHAVSGFTVVTRDASGAISPLLPAPAVSIANPGWDTNEDAENANEGQTATFDLGAEGPLGLMLSSGSALVAVDNEGEAVDPPNYELCVLQQANCPVNAENTGAVSTYEGGDPSPTPTPTPTATTYPNTGAAGTDVGGHCLRDTKWLADGQPARLTSKFSDWVAPPYGSKWIGNECDSDHSRGGDESHEYQVTLTLDSAIDVTGRVAVDNSVDDIVVNGASIGVSVSGYGTLHAFTIPAAALTAGDNTIVFQTTNDDNSGSDNPHGLLVVWDQPEGDPTPPDPIDGCNEDSYWTVDGDPAKLTAVQPGWVEAPAGSAWIADECDTAHAASTDTTYDVATTVTITGAGATIKGRFAVDAHVVDVLVNGVSSGISYTASETAGAAALQPFEITANLVQGANTLVWQVKNVGSAEDSNPWGLLVVFDQSCSPQDAVAADALSLPSSVAVSGYDTLTCVNAQTVPDGGQAWDGVLTKDFAAKNYAFANAYPATKTVLGPDDIWIAVAILLYMDKLPGAAAPGWRLSLRGLAKIPSSNYQTLWTGELPGDSPLGDYTRVGDPADCATGPATLTVG